MLKFIFGDDLHHYPKLRRTMFQDRAWQFRERLGWDVKVGRDGAERDQYDHLNPIYVIWQKADGSHGGSMRSLPTTGRTMVNEHFDHITGTQISSPTIWECTRFCLSPDSDRNTATMLILGGLQLGLRFGATHTVGVFDERMKLIYRRLKWPPEVLGTQGEGKDAISVGIWEFNEETRDRLCAAAGISPSLIEGWIDQSIGLEKLTSATA
ncbi:acyl-homoserine-lactone synthase [Pseudaestuariivita rosea]|uniref:acyl-homoserine-lactone synthase n=1 Tax=Pseudaestuariivita rosea TaxID=2763263 RepID=UPI001ABB97AA|nr:acyl-homoserine-lactone synthase [Pseudaestuariivita rosea]